MTAKTGIGKTGKVRKLNKEALARVEANSERIVTALLEATEKGHVMSTRLLIELAEGCLDVDDGMKTKVGNSLAARLAKEPEWQDPSLEAPATHQPATR
jgi:hypothetical protein